MSNRRIILLLLLVLALSGASYGWYLYNKAPDDIRKEKADIELSAGDLLSAYKQDETLANQRYTDRILSITGQVNSIQVSPTGQATLLIDTGDPLSSVVCSFYADEAVSVKELTRGSMVKVKGKCTGMLTDIILNKCSMVN